MAQLVYAQLVLPITTMFDGGRVLPESEHIMLYRLYVEDLADFEPEAYATARICRGVRLAVRLRSRRGDGATKNMRGDLLLLHDCCRPGCPEYA